MSDSDSDDSSNRVPYARCPSELVHAAMGDDATSLFRMAYRTTRAAMAHSRWILCFRSDGVLLTARDHDDKVLTTLRVPGTLCDVYRNVRHESYEISFPDHAQFRELFPPSRSSSLHFEIRPTETGFNKLVQVVSGANIQAYEVDIPHAVHSFADTPEPANPKYTFRVDRASMAWRMRRISHFRGNRDYALHCDPKTGRFQMCWGPAVDQPPFFEFPVPAAYPPGEHCGRDCSSSEEENNPCNRFQQSVFLPADAIQAPEDAGPISLRFAAPDGRIFSHRHMKDHVGIEVFENGDVCYVYRFGNSESAVLSFQNLQMQ